MRFKNRSVEVRENRDAGERCHCRLLDLYISKMLEDAKLKDLFYLSPLENVKNEDACWYYNVPVDYQRLYLKCVSWLEFQVVTQITVYEQLELPHYTQLVFQKRSFKSTLVIAQ